MKLFIQNMASLRCKMLVKHELETLGIPYTIVELGEVSITEGLSQEKHDQLKTVLRKSGLELMDDKKAMLIEKIKNVIIEMVHYADEIPDAKISVYLTKKLGHNYRYMADVFSETKGITIALYIQLQRIEKVKELIVYDELSLTEIAYKLHYSSVAHLSTQFKRVTGLTPSFFKSLKDKRRTTIENL